MSYVGDGRAARVDGALVQPELEWVVLSGPGARGAALLRNFSPVTRLTTVSLGSGHVTAFAYDQRGRLVTTRTGWQGRVRAMAPPSGFTVVVAD